MRRAYAAVAALWLWAALLLATHAGGRSPYAYTWAMLGRGAQLLNGAVVNPDAIAMVPVAKYFYDGEEPSLWTWAHAPNFRLPLHGFVVSVLMPFGRSTLLANYVANLGALMLLAVVAVKACERYGLRLLPSTLVLMTIYALPWVVTYVGQPMHYTVATAINFLVVLAAFCLSDDELRRPLVSSLLVAIVLLNYDPYIYAIALAAWVLFVIRPRRKLDVPIFIAVAIAPQIVWTQFIRRESHDALSRMTERAFIKPIADGWLDFLRHPIDRAVQPYLAGHIGTHVGFHLILAEIYWPLLLVLAAALWRLGDRIPRTRRAALVAALVIVFAVHQFGTALFDWENNPRRALPVVLAAGIAYCWCAAELWPRRAWRVAFAAVFAVCALATFSDTLIARPMLAYYSTGQAVQFDPRLGMQMRKMHLTKESLPLLMKDDDVTWRDLGSVSLPPRSAPKFFATQLAFLFFCCALLWMLARAQLLPRYAAAAGALVWLASLVRFL